MDNYEFMHPALRRHFEMQTTTQRFEAQYRCYSSDRMPGTTREVVAYGGKCILPASALDRLSRLNISWPILFELRNEEKDKTSHLGVLEFIAEEGRIYLPPWMMKSLSIPQGDIVILRSVDLPQGTFVKVQPQSVDFLDISDPKAVLENVLRNFSTLTEGDIFEFLYNERIYRIAVLEVKPENSKHAISVVETDLEVDFAAPVGYEEHVAKQQAENKTNTASRASRLKFGQMAQELGVKELVLKSLQRTSRSSSKFDGDGQRISGRTVDRPSKPESLLKAHVDPHIALHAPPGTLYFNYDFIDFEEEDDSVQKQKARGPGISMRDARRRAAENSDERD